MADIDVSYQPSADRVLRGEVTAEQEALILVHAWGGSLGERYRGIQALILTRPEPAPPRDERWRSGLDLARWWP